MVQPAAASAWMGGAEPRRAAMAALWETKARLCASPRDLRGRHEPTVGGDQIGAQEVALEQILGGPHAAPAEDLLDLPAALVEMDRVARAPRVRQHAGRAQQVGRAGLGRVGGHAAGDASTLGAVPALDEVGHARERGVRPRRRDQGARRSGVGDDVARALGEHQAQPAGDDDGGVGGHVEADLDQPRRARPDRLDGPQRAEDGSLLLAQEGGDGGGEPKGRGEVAVFLDAAGVREVQVRVAVGEAGEHRLAPPIDHVGAGRLGQAVSGIHADDPTGTERGERTAHLRRLEGGYEDRGEFAVGGGERALELAAADVRHVHVEHEAGVAVGDAAREQRRHRPERLDLEAARRIVRASARRSENVVVHDQHVQSFLARCHGESIRRSPPRAASRSTTPVERARAREPSEIRLSCHDGATRLSRNLDRQLPGRPPEQGPRYGGASAADARVVGASPAGVRSVHLGARRRRGCRRRP